MQPQGGFMYINYLDIVHLKCFRKDITEKQWMEMLVWSYQSVAVPGFAVPGFEMSSYARPRLSSGLSTSWGCNKERQNNHSVSLLPEVTVLPSCDEAAEGRNGAKGLQRNWLVLGNLSWKHNEAQDVISIAHRKGNCFRKLQGTMQHHFRQTTPWD